MQILDNPPGHLVLAKQLAETSDYGINKGTFFLGSVIATKPKGRVLSLGVNRVKSHPLQIKFTHKPERFEGMTISTHAEIDAISRCRVEDLIGSSIFVARILANGDWGNSRPCPGCMRAIRAFGIRDMFYFQDGNFCKERVR